MDLGFRKEEYLGVLEDTFTSVAGDSSPFAPIQFDYSVSKAATLVDG